MVNDAGGIKSLGGAKLNLIVSDVQSDPTVTRTETDRLISGYKPAAIHGAFASALTLIASEVAERAKVPLLTGSSSDQLNKDRHFTFTPFSRASQFALAQLQMSKLVSDHPKVAVIFENTAYQKQFGEFLFEYAGGLVAQTFMIADALERAASTEPQKVRDALAALDVSEGYAAMCPGGKVKFGPDGKNIYAHPVGVQWQHGDLATVFPKEDARAQLIKA